MYSRSTEPSCTAARSTRSIPPPAGRISGGAMVRLAAASPGDPGPAANPPFSMWSTMDLGRLRSEEHTSELQSHLNLVCRLLLEKKKSDTVINFKKQGKNDWISSITYM